MKQRMMNPLFLGLGSILLIATPLMAQMPSVNPQGRILSTFLYESPKREIAPKKVAENSVEDQKIKEPPSGFNLNSHHAWIQSGTDATHPLAEASKLDFQGRIRSAFLYETTKEDVIDIDKDGNFVLSDGKAETTLDRSSRMGFLADSKIAAEGTVEHDGIKGTAYFEVDVQDTTRSKTGGGFNLHSHDAWVQAETKAFYLKIGRQDFDPFYAFHRPYLAINSEERLMGSLIGFDEGVLVGTRSVKGWDLKLGLKVDSLNTENTVAINPVALKTFADGTEFGVAATHKTVEGEPDRGGQSEQQEAGKQLSLWYKGRFQNWQPYLNIQGTKESSDNLNKANLKTESDINTSEVFLGVNYILENSMVTTSMYHQFIHDKTDGVSSDNTTQVFSINYGHELLTGLIMTAGLNTTLTVFESKLLDSDSAIWSYTTGLSYYF